MSNIPKRKYDADIPSVSRTEDRTNRHATDQFLRAHGFAIFSREPGLIPIWIRDGRTYDEDVATRIAKKEQDKMLAAIQDDKPIA